MRIALVLEKFDPRCGGLEIWTHQYASWLLHAGHKVDVVTFEVASPLPLKIHQLSWSPWPRVRARRIASCLATLDVDIVHDMGDGEKADIFHPQTSSRITSLEQDLAGSSSWQRLAFAISPRCWRWKNEIASLERQQALSSGHLVAISELVKCDFVSRYGLCESSISIIPNGVDTARFRSSERPLWREQWRHRLGVTDETLFILIANNFHLKGVDNALKALQQITSRGEKAHLAVVGQGDIKRYIRKTKRMGLAENVSFLGWVDSIEEIIAAADASLQPSLHDACSLATLEALAGGLPVITSRANGAAQFITPGSQGFIIEHANDIDSLATAMTSLLDADRRTSMSRNVEPLIASLELSKQFESLTALYQRLISDKCSP